jgi:hypothetical protein
VVPHTATVGELPSVGAALCPQATMTPAALGGHRLCQVPGEPAIWHGQRRQEHV